MNMGQEISHWYAPEASHAEEVVIPHNQERTTEVITDHKSVKGPESEKVPAKLVRDYTEAKAHAKIIRDYEEARAYAKASGRKDPWLQYHPTDEGEVVGPHGQEYVAEFIMDRYTTIKSEISRLQSIVREVHPQLSDTLPTRKVDRLLAQIKELQAQSKKSADEMKIAQRTYQFLMSAVDRALQKGENLTVQLSGNSCGGIRSYPSRRYWVSHNPGKMLAIRAVFNELRQLHWDPRIGGLNEGTLCEDQRGFMHTGGNCGIFLLIHCDLTDTVIVEDKKER